MNQTVDLYLSYLNESDTYIVTESINIDSIKNLFSKKLQHVEKELRKYKVDIDNLKEFGKDLSNRLERLYKQDVSPQEAADILVPDIKTKLKSIAIRAGLVKIVGKNLLLPFLMFFVVLIINTCGMALLVPIVGPQLAFAIAAITVGPIVEETLKTFYIKMKIPYSGTAVTFGLEFLMYAARILVAGGSLDMVLLLRIPGLILHFFTTYLQKHIREKGKYLDHGDYNKLAWFTAVFVHMAYNITVPVVAEIISEL